MNQRQLSSPAARSGPVEFGAAVKKREGSLFFPGVEEGAAFFHLLQFPNQTHPRQPEEERPKGETRALGCCRRRRARDAGGVRAAKRKARVSGLRRPHEGRVTAAREARRAAARRERSVPSSRPGRGGGGAEERRGGRGTGGRLGAEAGPPVPSLFASLTLTAPRYAEQERGTKERGGERGGRGRAPSRLPEDPGRRKPKCHLNPTRGAGAWDPSAWISNNGWSASYKLRESRRGRRTIACPLRPAPGPSRPQHRLALEGELQNEEQER